MKIKSTKSIAGDYQDIAERMRGVRLDARLTQKDMAKIVDLTPAAISAMENGLYTPNFGVLRALKKKLGVSYEFVIDGVKTPENSSKIISENKELRSEVERLRRIVDKLLK